MAANPPAGISVRDLTKRYGAQPAVQDVCFDVAPGEIFGLLGANGAGKTTTLECIVGLRRPDSGAIAINGIDALGRPAATRPLVGAVLQDAALQDRITPREALHLFASFYREHAAVDQLLGCFDLEEKADASFASLSGGQRQRLFLALALVHDPCVLVLDEPAAGLDPQARRDLHGIIAGLRSAGRTVLLSTHDLGEAQNLCDRIGIIDRGRIVAMDSPASLIGRAKAPPRVFLRPARPLSAAEVRGWPGVVSAEPRNDGWMLGTPEVTRTIVGMTRQLEGAGNELLDLQIHRPTLEDVFLEITGRTWETEVGG